MLLKSDEKRYGRGELGGEGEADLGYKWFGCDVMHAASERSGHKSLMVHTQCPGTADGVFNKH